MSEIKTLKQGRHLYKCYFIPPEDLDRRAKEIAAGVMRVTKNHRTTLGNTCPHYGGDYWFHFGQEFDASTFCNIPPCPPGFYLGCVTKEECYETVLQFLKDRNTYFERVLAYFENEME